MEGNETTPESGSPSSQGTAVSIRPVDHQLHCDCFRCRSTPKPSTAYLEANYLAALSRLTKRAQPIRDYFDSLLKWEGGGALPEDPSKGAKIDFVEAFDAFLKAARERKNGG